jgi:hypothetical protein
MATPQEVQKPAAPASPAGGPRKLTPVLNNTLSILHIGLMSKVGERSSMAKVLVIPPGQNLIPSDEWAQAAAQQQQQIMLATRIKSDPAPESTGSRVGQYMLVVGTEVDADNPLAKLSEDEATRFVTETFQVPVLKRLLEQEQRGAVMLAIRSQIEKIEEPKKSAKAKA